MFTVLTNSSCSEWSSCASCINTGECSWCTSSLECVLISSNADCSNQIDMVCNSDYTTIIFIIILSAVVFLFCATCFLRRYNYIRNLDVLDPLLPNDKFKWRTSLKDDEIEWMCVICGFDNKFLNKDCTLCGTPQEFSSDYKSEKNSFKKSKKEKRIKKEIISINDSAQLKTLDQPVPSNLSIKIDIYNENSKDKDICPSTPNSIPISISTRPTIKSDFNEISSTSISNILSPLQRRNAFNYRRLNQLSLRQKAARRRRMWQRTFDEETGQLTWKRQAVSDTMVANSPFGYTPRNSISEKSLLSGYISSTNSQRSGDNFANILVDAATSSRNVSIDSSQLNNSPKLNNKINDHPRSDSFGDSTLFSSSPGFTSILDVDGELNWERVESGNVANRSVVPRSPQTSYKTSFDYSDAEDLEQIAAYSFREKQEWFMNHMGKLQKPWSSGCIRLDLERNKILELSHNGIMSQPKSELTKWIRIVFVGEPGIDAGGLEREWFGLVMLEIFDPKNGFFTCSSRDNSGGGTYHINPLSGLFKQNHLSYFRFIGRLFGKAIMEHQAISALLCLPLRKQILSLPITFSDLEFVDVELFRNLMWLKNNNNVDSLGLDFTVTYDTGIDRPVTYDLVINGSEIAVTDENKDLYLQLRLQHRMLDSIKPQLKSLLHGIYEVISPDLLSVFDYQELELLMCGLPEIDINDWRKNTEYLGEYYRSGEKNKIIKWFWASVEAMSTEEKVRLLQYTTGCSRLPASGFKHLQSNDGNFRKFNIQSIPRSDSLYPRSHTCFNKLDLPVYESQTELDAYLSIVINMEITGFTME